MARNSNPKELLNQNESTQDSSKPESHTDQAKLIQSLIDAACTTDEKGEVTLNKDSRISVTDLIRLLQYQREMVKQQPVDIVEMRWIDPPKS